MSENISEFKSLLEISRSVLVTSHISPDPDAVCSVLLLGTTLKFNYPDKHIDMVLEEKPTRDLSFLTGYSEIQFLNLLETLQKSPPDLLVVVDANNFSRVSRLDGTEIKKIAQKGNFKSVAIDHHEEADKADFDLFINNHSIATTQDIYQICFNELKLKKPQGYEDTTMLGIISDSNRFKYANPNHRQTFAIVSDVLDAGANIEALENRMERYDLDQMRAMSELAKNITSTDQGYNYSFITDSFANEVRSRSGTLNSVKKACDEFSNSYTRNTGSNRWGFVVSPEPDSGPNMYAVSLRSVSGVMDVSKIAQMLGGGGHVPAAGAKFHADSTEDAVEKVKDAIAGAVDED